MCESTRNHLAVAIVAVRWQSVVLVHSRPLRMRIELSDDIRRHSWRSFVFSRPREKKAPAHTHKHTQTANLWRYRIDREAVSDLENPSIQQIRIIPRVRSKWQIYLSWEMHAVVAIVVFVFFFVFNHSVMLWELLGKSVRANTCGI